jgi:mannosyl-3-phosphoglycerate phosphatase
MLRALAFSDLDGTLLDAETFAWEGARPGLDALHRGGIPLVFTSSKTRPELEAWRQRLGNTDPFISENGGALYLPADWTPMPDRADPVGGGLVRVEIGVPLNRLRVALREISAELGVALRGFGDMPRSEVAELSGLDGLALDHALAREYDEPFLPDPPLTGGQKARLAELARARWLSVTRGGRFYHLTGPTSKARAARFLIEMLPGPLTIIAAGDAPNDLELLGLAHHPIVVAQPGGGHADELKRSLPKALFTRDVGPAGFTEGIQIVLERITDEH